MKKSFVMLVCVMFMTVTLIGCAHRGPMEKAFRARAAQFDREYPGFELRPDCQSAFLAAKNWCLKMARLKANGWEVYYECMMPAIDAAKECVESKW